ncbi:MAG: PTS sugar transporter subunit IIA [Candidatus Cloacimonadota bacterium]|nr:PTS sugar transporter subunit IIA [Candidatus Cloacimonadota bacterium]
MELKDKLSQKMCVVELQSKRKKDVVHELVSIMKDSKMFSKFSEEQLFNAFMEREEVGSTGLGGGIAIPHTKLKGIDDFLVLVAISKKGVNFEAADKKKVHIFFALIGPSNKPNEYLQLLSKIARFLKNKKMYYDLLNAKTPEVIYETIVMETSKEKTVENKIEKKKLLLIVLYEEKFLEDILELFIEVGVKGSTVIDSIGMGGILTKVPLFADFTNFLGENKNYSKTILALINESKLKQIVNGVEEIMGNLNKHRGAAILSLDVDFFKGTMEFM